MKALSRWKERVKRMEQRMGIGTSQGAEMIYYMPNLEGDDEEESDRAVRLCHGMWAMAWCGPPFSPEQIAELKAEYSALTLEQAAERFNVSIKRLQLYMLRKDQIDLRTGAPLVPLDEINSQPEIEDANLGSEDTFQ